MRLCPIILCALLATTKIPATPIEYEAFQVTANVKAECKCPVCGCPVCQCDGGVCRCPSCQASEQIVSVGVDAPGADRRDWYASQGYAPGVYRFVADGKGWYTYDGQVKRGTICEGDKCRVGWVKVQPVTMQACTTSR